MKRAKIVGILGLVIACFSTALAQAPQCASLVEKAMQAVGATCLDTGRNQACYGNLQLDAQFQSGFTNLAFSQPGERVNVASLKTLTSTQSNPDDELWGIALMKLQANVPDTLPGQSITLIVLGGVEVENAVTSNPNVPAVKITAKTDSVLRDAPTSDGQIVGAIVTGDDVTVLGKSPDELWLRVELVDTDQRLGWIPLSAAEDTNVTTLAVIDPNNMPFSPMQAFYLRPRFHGTGCADAPDGMLVQAPEANIKLQLTVNEVQIELASTVFLQVGMDNIMTANVLEGEIQMQSGGVTVDVPSGYRASVPLDADQKPTGAPSAAEPYDAGILNALPLSLLPESFSPVEPVWAVEQSLCVTNPNGAWMRSTPSSQNTDVIQVLALNTAVGVTGSPQFDGTQSWWSVRTGNNTGWIEQSALTACTQPVLPPCTPRTDWPSAYTVKSGDTLSTIALGAGMTLNQVATGNCLEAPYNLSVGKVLHVLRTPVFTTATPPPTATIRPARPTSQPKSGDWRIEHRRVNCNNGDPGDNEFSHNETIAIQFSADSTTASLTLDQVLLTLKRPTGSLGYENEMDFLDPVNGYLYRTTLFPLTTNGEVPLRGQIREERICPTVTAP